MAHADRCFPDPTEMSVSALERIWIAVATLLIGMAFHPVAMAFQVQNLNLGSYGDWSGSAVHEDITRVGLANVAVSLSDGSQIKFTARAIEEVVKQNAWTDSAYVSEPARHFDREEFDQGNQILVAARLRVARLANYQSPSGAREARLAMGTALHTLQDFYAHSTWVELGNLRPAPLGDTNLVFNTPSAIGTTCAPFGLLALTPLTSGYFSEFQLVVNSYVYELLIGRVTLDKCTHGSPVKSNSDSGGINKDGPQRLMHTEARYVAILATTQYVSEIINGTQVPLSDAAKCLLLGHTTDTGGQCSGGSGSVTINFDGVDTSAGYANGAAVSAYLAGYGIATPNFLTVMDTTTYAPFIRSPTKNILTGGDGRNPTIATLEFQEPVSDISFVRAGVVGALSPSGTIAGPWTATAYDASNSVVGLVGEDLQSFFGDRPFITFVIAGSGIVRLTFSGSDFGYAGINVPHLTNLKFKKGP
jgi:hypothetical protein